MEEYVNFECTHIADADQSTSDEHSALAYADIDGHPKDEDAAGAVICRVWMLKEKQGIYPRSEERRVGKEGASLWRSRW